MIAFFLASGAFTFFAALLCNLLHDVLLAALKNDNTGIQPFNLNIVPLQVPVMPLQVPVMPIKPHIMLIQSRQNIQRRFINHSSSHEKTASKGGRAGADCGAGQTAAAATVTLRLAGLVRPSVFVALIVTVPAALGV
ncbi:hypothetical protein AA18890_2207 [Komagataeibacter europaeus LMG 18890]|nr:hypothetical protein AA18890_2207 [Komagataeibacter europaeus LMG 18890]